MTDTTPFHRTTALRSRLESGIDQGLFDGAVVVVGSTNGVDTHLATGQRNLAGDPVTPDTKFDVASLTKVVATTTITLRLVEAGELTLSSTVGSHIDELHDTQRGAIPLRSLLTHTSGLPPYKAFPFGWESKSAVLESLFDSPLSVLSEPNEWYVYSDLNFVFLAEVLRRVTGESLATLFETYVTDPLGLTDTAIGPIQSENVAATRDRRWADRVLEGEIHDYLGRAMDGESGNAGIFSTGRNLATVARMLLSRGVHGEGRFLSSAMVDRLRTDAIGSIDASQGLGWKLGRGDTPGTAWSPDAFGHTGFTGTSMWIDPDRDQFVVLLTNHALTMDPDGSLEPFRQQVHDIAAATTKRANDS
ncbi:serine hydrolase domain-containing protein [Natronorubrum halophilum]|uniref:serine hydrolase domain-containing protein n=1 Tax=Natronorubrum halophilum TaxID=1702106 RepID=UPI000EF6A68C|nr:serine hydrolase domain-containing protein [Natronorubrum halophilum]